MTQQTVGKWEAGAATPSMATLSRVANLFDVSLAYFEDEPPLDLGQDLIDKQNKAIVALIELLGTEKLAGGNLMLPNSNRHHSIAHVLWDNGKANAIIVSALGMLLDTFVVGALELSKINLNKSIALLTNEAFDTNKSVNDAKQRMSIGIDQMIIVLKRALDALPSVMFDEFSSSNNKDGEPDGERN